MRTCDSGTTSKSLTSNAGEPDWNEETEAGMSSGNDGQTKAPAGERNGADPTARRHPWLRAMSALQHRDFRLLWAGTFVSNAGSWMQKVATAWLIYQMTGSEAWLGIDA